MNTIEFHLKNLLVLEIDDVSDFGDEPYLWVFYISIDENATNTIKYTHDITNFNREVLSTNTNIPENIGKVRYDISSFSGENALMGFFIMAWDWDSTSGHLVQETYKKTSEIINEKIRNIVSEYNVFNSNTFREIEKKLIIFFSSDYFNNFRYPDTIGLTNDDDYIGSNYYFLQYNKNKEYFYRNTTLTFKGNTTARYIIEARVPTIIKRPNHKKPQLQLDSIYQSATLLNYPYIWVFNININKDSLINHNYVIKMNDPSRFNIPIYSGSYTTSGNNYTFEIPENIGSVEFKTTSMDKGFSIFGTIIMTWMRPGENSSDDDPERNRKAINNYHYTAHRINDLIKESILSFGFDTPSPFVIEMKLNNIINNETTNKFHRLFRKFDIYMGHNVKFFCHYENRPFVNKKLKFIYEAINMLITSVEKMQYMKYMALFPKPPLVTL